MTETMKNRIMIFGPKADATYVVEFRTARARRWRFQYRNSCVRFVFGAAAASRNTRFQGARYGFTWAELCTGRWRQLCLAPSLLPRRRARAVSVACRGRALSPPQVDHQLKFRRKLKRHIAQLCALQYLVHI